MPCSACGIAVSFVCIKHGMGAAEQEKKSRGKVIGATCSDIKHTRNSVNGIANESYSSDSFPSRQMIGHSSGFPRVRPAERSAVVVVTKGKQAFRRRVRKKRPLFGAAEGWRFSGFRLQDCGPSIRPLVGGGFFDARRNCPDVAGRVHDPAGAITPKLVLRREQDLRAGGDGSVEGGIDVLDVNENHDWRGSVELRSTAGQARPFRFDHDVGAADRKEGVRDSAVGSGAHVQFGGTEGGLTELDFAGGVAADEHRHDGGDAGGKG
jgi:hypothetical protein